MWKASEAWTPTVRSDGLGDTASEDKVLEAEWIEIPPPPTKVSRLATRLSVHHGQEIRSVSPINRKLNRTSWFRRKANKPSAYPDPPSSDAGPLTRPWQPLRMSLQWNCSGLFCLFDKQRPEPAAGRHPRINNTNVWNFNHWWSSLSSHVRAIKPRFICVSALCLKALG